VIYPRLTWPKPLFGQESIGEQRFTQKTSKEAVMKLLFGVYLVGILVTVTYFSVIGLSHH
jgi:hypothetical protein